MADDTKTPAHGPPEPGPGSIRSWIATNSFVAISSGIGLVFYGVLRLDYSLFYSQLGLRPEDVGLGYSEILTQTLAGLFLTLCVLFVMFFLLAHFPTILYAGAPETSTTSPASPKEAGREQETGRPRWQVAAGVVVLALVAFFGWWVLVRASAWIGTSAWNVLGFSAFSASFVAGLVRTVRRGRADFLRRSRVNCIWGLAFSIVLVLFVYSVQAWTDGEAVRLGQAAHATLGPFPIASWGASFASVAWAGDRPASVPTECLLYLGEGNGKAVFFDVRGQRSVRIPSAGLTIMVDADRQDDPSCRPAAHT